MPTDIIHTVSNSSREDLVKFGAKAEIKVIPNGVDITIYDNAQPIKDYQNFVLFIGRLVFYKNLGTVISAFVDVLAKSPGSKMLIVGDGPMREKWLKMASDLGLSKNIDFIGHVSDERKIELLSKCSALLLPSFVEGFGLVILESFAMSKPVLVANVKPLSDIVDDGIDGFILPVDDPVKWSEKISYLINNREICKKMGNQGRSKLEKKFRLEHVLDKIEPVYENLAKRRRKAIR
jgi:glycosyltransferase involved in cell wall biosynthesis